MNLLFRPNVRSSRVSARFWHRSPQKSNRLLLVRRSVISYKKNHKNSSACFWVIPLGLKRKKERRSQSYYLIGKNLIGLPLFCTIIYSRIGAVCVLCRPTVYVRLDLHVGNYIQQNASKCDELCTERSSCCDDKATCGCGTHTGYYECICPAGYYGSGLRHECYRTFTSFVAMAILVAMRIQSHFSDCLHVTDSGLLNDFFCFSFCISLSFLVR